MLRSMLAMLTFIGSLTVSVNGEDLTWRAAEHEGVTAWRVGGKSVRLGTVSSSADDYAWVEVPVCVLFAAKQVLAGPVKTWHVNKINDFKHKAKKVVLLSDRRNNHFICLVEKSHWIRLNEKRGLPAINELLGKDLRSKPANMKTKNLVDYAQDFAFLYRGPQRVVTSREFLNVVKTFWDAWLEGTEKDSKQLRKLCFNPIITQSGADVQFVFNVISSQGAIEKWTLSGRVNERIHIRSVKVETVRPPGTFFFGFVG